MFGDNDDPRGSGPFHPINNPDRRTPQNPADVARLATPEAQKLAKANPNWGPKRILRELST
ncbi:hypothetical protein [Nonomuraea turcica]|uniref:hypothetical protein n=1 Tax=Nonomuraea sp. G32 TaxID=3067274 RepID=UPI00273BE20A|nr:hypothetical protein [Nonomuraea sp. G32]MDP4501109.1 hypothetical protein [Nonomuraea sp. G32]